MIQINAGPWLAWMKARQGQLEQRVQRGLLESAKYAAGRAKQTKRFKDRLGNLRRSIGAEPYGRLGARAITRSNHAAFIENGNKPGGTGDWIYPKKAKYLRFVVNGDVVYARRVRPLTPRKFMLQAREESVVYTGFQMAGAVKDSFQ